MIDKSRRIDSFAALHREYLQALKDATDASNGELVSKKEWLKWCVRNGVKTHKGVSPKMISPRMIHFVFGPRGFIETRDKKYRITKKGRDALRKEPVGKSPQDMGEWFENKIVDFMDVLGFKDIGHKVKFGESDEVDVVAGWGNMLFLIECRWKGKRGRHNLRKDIKEIKGGVDSIIRGARNHKKYSKYNGYKFVLATRNCIFRDADKDYAEMGPKKRRVFMWDESIIRYYTDLAKTIGSYAKFDLFGEMGIVPLDTSPIRIPSFRIKQGKYETFVFMIDPKELLKYCYVARRERGEGEYYQRIIKGSRIKEIAKYIDEEGGFFPNNIIVAINKPCRFFTIEDAAVEEEWPRGLKFGILQFPRDYRSMWIVDGQHRLFSYGKSSLSSKLPVLAFKNLDTEEQAKFFIDINQNQKRVEPNLMWDLQGELRPGEEEGIISNAVKRLGKDALDNIIYIPLQGKHKNNKVKLSAICIAIKRCGLARKYSKSNKEKRNLLYSKSAKRRTQNLGRELNRFFTTVQGILSKQNINDFVLTNGGIAVMIYVYERLLSGFKKIPKEQQLKKYLKPFDDFLRRVQIKRYIDRCNSEGGRKSVLEEFINVIAIEVQDDKLLATVTIPKIGDKIANLERRLGSLLDRELSRVSDNWYKQRVGPEIYKRLKDRKERKVPEDPREALHEFLTFGEIAEIIERSDNKEIFEEIFIGKSGGFASREEFLGALGRLKKYRSPPHHGVRLSMDSSTIQLIGLYINRIENCIKKFS